MSRVAFTKQEDHVVHIEYCKLIELGNNSDKVCLLI